MKKLIGFICFIAVILPVTRIAFAEVVPPNVSYEADAKNSVTEAAEKIRNAKVLSELFVLDEDDIEKIEVVYPGDGDPNGCYIDKSKFFDIAETVALIPERRIDKADNNNGVLIIAVDKNDERTSVWINNKGRVACQQYETSSAVTSQYDISNTDYIRLYTFLPEEATAHMPLENPMNNYIFVAVGVAVSIFIVAFVIGFWVNKKNKRLG